MRNVKVVTAYVNLPVHHLTTAQFKALGRRLETACDGKIRVFDDYPLAECWLSLENPPLIPAAPVPADRYATPDINVMSHIVQHNRTEWALMAAEEDPNADVIVWLDYGILKQGAFTGKPVTEQTVWEFLSHVAAYTGEDIPFPGITPRGVINAHGDNWRFCGSTHIWPVEYLYDIDQAYKDELRSFIRKNGCVPLDLTIWPAVERHLDLPFSFYQAEYDATQLTGFPHA